MADSSDWQSTVAESEVDGSTTVGLVVGTSGATGATVGADCKDGLAVGFDVVCAVHIKLSQLLSSRKKHS